MRTACSLSTQPMASPKAAWSRTGAAARSPTTRSTTPSSSPPSGTDASAGFGTCSASSRTAASAAASTASASVSSAFERAGRFDQRRALLGRGLADRLRRRVLPGAQVLDQSQRIPPGGVGREHVVDQTGRDPLALDARAVLRFVAEPAHVDHGVSPPRIWSRRPSSHEVASRHALGDGLPAHVAFVAGDGVGAEELHLCLLRGQVAEAVGDELVVEMALEVDEEAVVAEVALGRPRLELGDVDGPGRELLEDGEQRAGAVLALEAHDRGLVVPGGSRDAVAHDHEPGLVLGVVLDLAGEDLEALVRRSLAGADRRHALLARLRHLAGRLGGGVGGDRGGVGQVLRHPHPGLAERVRVGDHGGDVGDLGAGRDAEVERHRQVDLLLDEQLGVEGEGVEGDGDRALDRVLDGHDPEVDVAVLDRGDHVRDVAVGDGLARGEVGLRAQRLFRERAVGPEEPDPGHRREA